MSVNIHTYVCAQVCQHVLVCVCVCVCTYVCTTEVRAYLSATYVGVYSTCMDENASLHLLASSQL